MTEDIICKGCHKPKPDFYFMGGVCEDCYEHRQDAIREMVDEQDGND
jgi:protein-arginine kinase activator protein McsA